VTATLHEVLAEFRYGLERTYGPRLDLFGSQARDDFCPRHPVVITRVYMSAEETRAADGPPLLSTRAEGVPL
jgi:hypothetical protein